MIGGLCAASQLLLHPFLRENLAKLGGTPNLPTDQMTPTVIRLQKRAQREPVFDLKASWRTYRVAFWATHRQQVVDPNSNGEWDKHEEESLDACLIELRRRQVMFQGHQWTCRKCHHRNWLDFGALSSELLCEVCKQARAPAVW
jgi:hypothetical protein